MYNGLKAIAKNIIPRKVLIRNEFFFRSILSPFYKGENCKCNICETKLKRFATLPNGDLICPICGSLSRARRLYMLIEDEFLKPNFSLLDFSPMRMLYSKLKKRKDISYYASDYEDEFIADYKFDIRNIDSDQKQFDLILCYHVLEHIVEDHIAMKELYRVLKIGGNLLVQTPFKEGEIYENEEVRSSVDRLKHFGQDDHVRIYSASGLEKRLMEAGFKTEIRTLKKDDFYGFSDNEKIIIGVK